MEALQRGKVQRVVRINAKCSDLFWSQLQENGTVVGEYSGYVPDWMPGEHYGDYVELNIDVATGQILNWKKPTKEQLLETFRSAQS